MFKSLDEFPDYIIGEDGDIYSLKFGKVKKLKPTYTNCNGIKYLNVQLTNEIGRKAFKVHWLVWQAFNGERPMRGSGMVIDHIDRDPMNNKLSNLRVATLSENQLNSKRCSK